MSTVPRTLLATFAVSAARSTSTVTGAPGGALRSGACTVRVLPAVVTVHPGVVTGGEAE